MKPVAHNGRFQGAAAGFLLDDVARSALIIRSTSADENPLRCRSGFH
jgi:hypothetical protein